MLQGWYDLASVHWPYDPDLVQRLLPAGLRVDTCGGRAWVGVIPFEMRRIRVPGLPALGRLSTFAETNVRTYVVTPDGRRGVWFASLDVTRLLPAIVARTTYGLPYCWSRMAITRDRAGLIAYTTHRRWPRRADVATSRIVIEIGDFVDEASLTDVERFVTARWALASTLARRAVWAPVDHEPWPLHRADLLEWDDTLLTSAGLPAPGGDPVVLWSPGVEVRIGRPTLA